MRAAYLLFFLLVCSPSLLLAQQQESNNPYTDTLKKNLETATTAEQKVRLLGKLAQFYMGPDKALSDEYAEQQAQVAETSRDRKLMIQALHSNAQRYYNMAGRQDNITTGISYSQKALDLAKVSNLNDYEAWSYMLLARGARSNGDNDKALNYNNLAVSLANTIDNDSLKIISFNSLGNTYLNKKENILAFRNYLQALNLAENLNRYELLKSCFLTMSTFYTDLEDYERAKDFVYKALTLTVKNKVAIDRHEIYNRLGQIYAREKKYDMAMDFYEKSLALADTLKFEIIKLNTYGLMMDSYIASNQVEKALEFFNSKPELKQFMKKAGFQHFIDQAYGIGYTQMGLLDSAYYYMKKSEPGFEKNASVFNKHWFFNNMATFYKKKGDYKTALTYNLKAKVIADEIGSMEFKQLDAMNLDSIYQKLGDFKNAYLYNRQYQQAKDSLEKLSAEKGLMVMEVENENKRKQREVVLAVEALREKHNIQYMAITVAIAAVFFILVMFGIFSVSETTIRVMGFFAFIFLFEFIILLADNQIHHWTHGEPWKILSIKIGLISILLPLHHFLEKRVINYLTSKKMFELNKEAILSKFSTKKATS
jgi:pentatricopeptide repeat protein